ncbi:MAG: Ribonuclease Y [Candidatus Latescibacteria bacterium ADurb.Bin168]|nr:MAG: Ribonuclease Y [Candidatus Latescibacteria bacterium ADurb.Bin168]
MDLDPIVFAIGTLALVVLAFVLGWVIARRAEQAKIGSAEDAAARILDEAKREAASLKQKVQLEARNQQLEMQERNRKEADAQRADLIRMEARLVEREAKLDRKSDELAAREGELNGIRKALETRQTSLSKKEEDLNRLISEQTTALEQIAHMTADEAREVLIANMESKARAEGARRAKEIRDRAEQDAEREAREIIGIAIQRFAGEHTTETTVSVVQLPNEEMKGRIIGREGRNIRAFEMATGVDVIVDDTPEAVILSGFDPVRREVARIAMGKLVEDGRIHPGRIEELVDKARNQVEEEAQRAGEEVVYELGIHDMHPQLVKTLGKLKYRTSYGQNVLQHAKEVGILTGLMAEQLGLDPLLARRAGLLHDIGKAVDRENEGTHVALGLELARRYGEHEEVQASIEWHHGDPVAKSIISVLVNAADTISSVRPGARRETIEGYVKRLERLESIAQAFDGVEKTYAIQAGREVRVMVKNDRVDDAMAQQLANDIAEKIQADMEYPGQIKVVVIRESRSVSYAK